MYSLKRMSFLLALFIVFSCEEIINEQNIANKTVELLAPTNNITITSGDIAFNWQVVDGAVEYELQVARPTFENAEQIVLDTVISTMSFSHTLTANDYEWRVKALNSAYETTYTTNAFVVEPVP